MRRFLLLLALVGLAVQTQAEMYFKSASVTGTTQTIVFKPSNSILLCNFGTNKNYYRLFNENETTAAATNAYPLLVAGTATAPSCIGFDKGQTEVAFYRAVSLICESGETATVHVIAK